MICKLHLQVASHDHLSSDKMLIHFVFHIWWNFRFGQGIGTDQYQNLILGVGWNRWIHHTATRTARRPLRPPARVPRHHREVHPRPPWSNMEKLSSSDTTGLCRRVSILEISITILSSLHKPAMKKKKYVHAYISAPVLNIDPDSGIRVVCLGETLPISYRFRRSVR